VIGSIGIGSTFFFLEGECVCKLFILRIGWIEPAALLFLFKLVNLTRKEKVHDPANYS